MNLNDTAGNPGKTKNNEFPIDTYKNEPEKFKLYQEILMIIITCLGTQGCQQFNPGHQRV